MKRAALLAGGGLLSTLGVSRYLSASQETYLSPFADAQGKQFVARFSLEGALKGTAELPFRVHGATTSPDGRTMVLFGRRPHTQCAVYDLETDRIMGQFMAQPGRHFFGHGCFSADGRYLFSSESRFASGEGIIGVRDTQSWQWLDEFPSGGIGPHDVHLLSHGKALVVANGGIRTHPDSGRKKLNLASMQPNLSYLSTASGALLQQRELPDPSLSIRHLHVVGDTVSVACQQQKARSDALSPLLAVDQPSRGFALVNDDDLQATRGLGRYLADTCICERHDQIAVTSPRGHRVSFWGLSSRAYLGSVQLRQASGISLSADGSLLLVTSNRGAIYVLDVATRSVVSTLQLPGWKGVSWDNHLIRVG